MKKFLSIIALAVTVMSFGTIGHAQQTSTTVTLTQSDSTSKTTATVINTGNKILSYAISNAWDCVAIGVTITKTSGTVGGTVIPVASMDGVNYFTISKPSIAITALRPAYSDTLTPANTTTQIKNYIFSSSAYVDGQTTSSFPWRYVGVKYTGTGTMVATMTGVATFRHK